MTTIQQIKSIINPVRVLKGGDFEKIAEILYPDGDIERNALILLSRYESLTSQPLTKKLIQEWFEGFEILSKQSGKRSFDVITHKNVIDFDCEAGSLIISNDADFEWFTSVLNPTVSDLIIEISRYNRTASKPVEINVTDSFIQELIK